MRRTAERHGGCAAHLLGLVVTLCIPFTARADDGSSLPDTLSPAARLVLEQLVFANKTKMVVPDPADIPGWKKFHEQMDSIRAAQGQKALESSRVNLAPRLVGGIPVLDVRPPGWADDGRLLLYIHGGAFTLLSAKSTAHNAALMAAESGLRVICINYTNPPSMQWDGFQQKILSVIRAQVSRGHAMDHIAIYGDSAEESLVVRTVLYLRDSGLGMPRAVVLFSPWADLTNSGDTAVTLKDPDPTLSYENMLARSARAYAGKLDLNDPRVSPDVKAQVRVTKSTS